MARRSTSPASSASVRRRDERHAGTSTIYGAAGWTGDRSVLVTTMRHLGTEA
jgi:hypothetical protein